MNRSAQPFRQVHLDFHTARACPNVGRDFDPEAFVATLKRGRVSSINVFARCHHGYSYYPTSVGTMHPELSFDLLGAQLAALRRAGIRAPIYMTVKWDDLAAMQHPEWLVVRRDGSIQMRPPLSGAWGWSTLDVATGYGDYVLAQAEELCERYDVDGFWFDICFTAPNYSPSAQERMRDEGVHLDDDPAVWRYAVEQDQRFFERVSSLVRRKAPGASIFFNGTVTAEMRRMLPFMSHIEVESLPTSGDAWGYLHYPIVARQARTYGLEIVGMTGRFHKSWADFGGLKTRDQLDYECGTIVAAGGKICVGDQLHPDGRLDPAVYTLLGHAFGRIERLEPWLDAARPTAEAAILIPGASCQVAAGIAAYAPDVEGAAQLLLELGIQFDIVDGDGDLTPYDLAILPDAAPLGAALRAKLERFLTDGGRLVLSGTAALDQTTGSFGLDGIPARFVGPAPTVPCYMRAGTLAHGELAADYDYVFYDQAYLVEPAPGATVYGELRQALFNRTWEHFTSHQHAPVGPTLNAPVAVRQGNVLYFAAPLFSGYRAHDYWAYRSLVGQALRELLPTPLLRPRGPGWAEFTLHTQPRDVDRPARRIVHVVAYQPRRSLQPVPHVDQAWPTAGLGVALRADGEPPERVYLAPDGESLPFTVRNGYIEIELPPAGPHTVVVVE